MQLKNFKNRKHKGYNEKNYLSEKSIPAQKQPIQNKIVHFLETTFFEVDSNPPPPPLLFQLILLLFYLLKTANQELNQNKPISNLKSTTSKTPNSDPKIKFSPSTQHNSALKTHKSMNKHALIHTSVSLSTSRRL